MDSALAQSLRRCAETLDQVLGDLYDADQRSSPVTRAVMLAAAALQAAADESGDAQRNTKLLIAATLSRDALTAVRASGLDETTLRCAETLDRAIVFCERALDPPSREREG